MQQHKQTRLYAVAVLGNAVAVGGRNTGKATVMQLLLTHAHTNTLNYTHTHTRAYFTQMPGVRVTA